ncbi:hypothetical protein [Paracoccus endophyticus]|uniref:hypothetical protein n=1 Tax=Paracoccus endophyticus TaxID=2233774 RepID=UPI000DD738FA|nr:hypothetical protein [Paracoccus endophyticus]
MTEMPARHLPGTLATPARPGMSPDDLGDVLASIRRLIAREDGDMALAGPSPEAAAPWTAPTMLRDPGGTGLPAAAQPGPASRAVPLQADPTSAQPPAPHGDAASLFGASHPTPDRGAVNDSAPLRLHPDALIPPAGTFRRPEGRLRLRSVLEANEAPAAPGGWIGATCAGEPSPSRDIGLDDGTVAGAAAVGDVHADLPAEEALHNPAAALPGTPHPHRAFTHPVAPEHAALAAPVPSQAPSLVVAGAPALWTAEPSGGWAAALPHGEADTFHSAEPRAPTIAVEPAALPEPPAPASTLLADAPPAPASLRGLVRAAIRQEIEGEIDRLVHGPLHRLIRAEVARAVAEVFDSTEIVRPGQG